MYLKAKLIIKELKALGGECVPVSNKGLCIFIVIFSKNRKSKGVEELCVHLYMCVYVKQNKGLVCVRVCVCVCACVCVCVRACVCVW